MTMPDGAVPAVRSEARRRLRVPPAMAAWAGPALIVCVVLVVMDGFWLQARLTNQQVDLLSFWFPRWCYLGRAVASGHLPAWLPNQFAGVPFASDPQSGWLYAPVMLLFSTFSCARAFSLFITLNPILAGLALYLFFRNEGLGRPASTAGGLTLAMLMSGSAIALSLPFAGMLAWIAVALAAASGFIHATDRARVVGWFALLGFGLSQVAAAHLTDGLMLAGFVLGLYLAVGLARQVRSGRRGPGPALAMLVAPLLAFPLLAAGLLFPPLSFLPRSSLGHGYVGLARLATELSGVYTPPAFVPGARPWWGTSFARGPAGYAGAVGILLIPWALASRRWRAPAAAFAATGFIGWILSLDRLVDWRPLHALAERHFIGQLWLHSPFRFRYLVVIALPALAAYGVQAWLDLGRAPSGRTLLERFLPMVGVAGVYVLWPAVAGDRISEYAFFAAGAAYGIPLLAALATRGKPALAVLLPLLLAVELGAAGLIQQRGPVPMNARDRFEKSAGSGFAVSFPAYHAPFISPATYLTPGPIGAALIGARPEHGRYLAFFPAVARDVQGFLPRQGPPDWGAYENGRSILFGIDEVLGYSPVQVDRYWRLLRRAAHEEIYYNAAFFSPIGPQVVRLFGVHWLILSSTTLPPRLVDPAPVAQEGPWRLYRVTDPAPRASIVFSVATVARGYGLDDVLDPSFDPKTRAIAEARPGFHAPVPSAPGSTGAADYAELSPEHVRVRVTSSADGLLVVRNVFDPNWHARVDGVPVPVVPADYLFQGIEVTAGTHVVDLTYRDSAIRWGLAVSATAWAVVLGTIGALVYRRRRAVPAPPAATSA